jgi:hypothetical protein
MLEQQQQQQQQLFQDPCSSKEFGNKGSAEHGQTLDKQSVCLSSSSSSSTSSCYHDAVQLMTVYIHHVQADPTEVCHSYLL